MRTFKLPGWDSFNNIIPYERHDDNKPLPKKAKKKKTKKQIAAEIEEFGKEVSEEEEAVKEVVPEEEVGMGGKENRVYWPVGMEEWLRPKKREIKRKGDEDEDEIFKNPTPGNFEARKRVMARNREPFGEEVKEILGEAGCVADVQSILQKIKEERTVAKGGEEGKKTPKKVKKEGSVKNVPMPRVKSKLEEEDVDEDLSMPDLSEEENINGSSITVKGAPARQSGRGQGKRKSYAEVDAFTEEE
jgi:UV DNA damage endonuclease